MSVQDKIERQMMLKAPRQKVWDAITKPDMLCKWFANRMDVTELIVGQEFKFDWTQHGYSRAVVETVEPQTRFVYRWENSGGNQNAPFADVPKTLVTFVLEDVEGGTRLTLTETGLAALPNAAQVLSENSHGWDTELAELKAYIEAA